MDFYKNNYEEYFDKTFNLDMSESYNQLLKYIDHGRLLDLGCGSGRDSFYFKKKFDVVALDNCFGFYEIIKERLGFEIIVKDIMALDYHSEFDVVWANASLLHFNDNQLKDIFLKIDEALVDRGYLFCSFKKGNFNGMIEDRYFNYLEQEDIEALIDGTSLQIQEIITSKDKGINEGIEWLNVIMQKTI